MFKEDRTKIDCFFNLTILDVISIDDTGNVFKAKFKIEIEWKDVRLKFRHAKKGTLGHQKSTNKVLFYIHEDHSTILNHFESSTELEKYSPYFLDEIIM